MADPKIENLTDVETAQFFEFLEFIISNQHTTDIVNSLKSNGFSAIRVSVEPIRHVQAFLKEAYKDKPTPRAHTVIMSGHHNGHCV